jgi:hypothetical protein
MTFFMWCSLFSVSHHAARFAFPVSAAPSPSAAVVSAGPAGAGGAVVAGVLGGEETPNAFAKAQCHSASNASKASHIGFDFFPT